MRAARLAGQRQHRCDVVVRDLRAGGGGRALQRLGEGRALDVLAEDAQARRHAPREAHDARALGAHQVADLVAQQSPGCRHQHAVGRPSFERMGADDAVRVIGELEHHAVVGEQLQRRRSAVAEAPRRAADGDERLARRIDLLHPRPAIEMAGEGRGERLDRMAAVDHRAHTGQRAADAFQQHQQPRGDAREQAHVAGREARSDGRKALIPVGNGGDGGAGLIGATDPARQLSGADSREVANRHRTAAVEGGAAAEHQHAAGEDLRRNRQSPGEGRGSAVAVVGEQRSWLRHIALTSVGGARRPAGLGQGPGQPGEEHVRLAEGDAHDLRLEIGVAQDRDLGAETLRRHARETEAPAERSRCQAGQETDERTLLRGADPDRGARWRGPAAPERDEGSQVAHTAGRTAVREDSAMLR